MVSGLLAYVVFALLTRGLGAGAAAPVVVLWSFWALAGAAFTFPLQHWIVRTSAAHGDGAVEEALPRVLGVVVAVGMVLGVLSWPAREALFHRDDAWFPVLVSVLTVGSALVGVLRGRLGARDRFDLVGWSLVAENALRCVIVAGLLVADVRTAPAHGSALVAGQLVVLLWPSTLRLAGRTWSPRRRSAFAFLGGAGSAQLVAQGVLNGGPVVLALSGGRPADVTAFFAALALFRAPYLVALGSVSPLTARATRLAKASSPAPLRRMVGGLAVGGTALTAVAAASGWLLGPLLLHLVFGSGVHLARGHGAAVAAGCSLALVNLLLMVVGMAQDVAARTALAWLLAVAAAAAALAVGAVTDLSPLTAGVAAFAVAEACAFVGLTVVAGRGGGSSPG